MQKKKKNDKKKTKFVTKILKQKKASETRSYFSRGYIIESSLMGLKLLTFPRIHVKYHGNWVTGSKRVAVFFKNFTDVEGHKNGK